MKLRFTGKRTGKQSIALPKFGAVQVGDEIEVDAETAARWTGLTRNGASDWEPVGTRAKHEVKEAAAGAEAQAEEESAAEEE